MANNEEWREHPGLTGVFPGRYSNVRSIGEGMYDKVFAAIDNRDQSSVPIKRMNTFGAEIPLHTKIRLAKSAFREIKILKHCLTPLHNSIIQLMGLLARANTSDDLTDMHTCV